MEIEYVLQVIDEAKEEWYQPPTSYNRKRIEFKMESYRRTAIEEIKRYLITHKNENPFRSIEDFRYQMDCFACNAKNGDTNLMFSVYYDVATDILDILLAMI